MNKISSLKIWLTGALLLCASCRGCHSDGPESLISLVGADAQAVVWVQSVRQSTEGLNDFLQHATTGANPNSASAHSALQRLREGAERQAGFDILDPNAYGPAGIDANTGILLFVPGGQARQVLALGVSDRAAFEKTLRNAVKMWDEAEDVSQSEHHGRSVSTLGRPFGAEIAASVHWCYVGRFVLIARGDSLGALDTALQRVRPQAPKNASLQDSPALLRARQRVPEAQVFAWGHGEAQAANTCAITSINVSAAGLRIDAVMVAPEATSWEQALGTAPSLPLADWLDPNAVAVLLSQSASPSGLQAIRTYRWAQPLLDRLLAQSQRLSGIDLEKQILPLCAGPLAAGLYVTDAAVLPQALRREHRVTALFDSLQVALVAELKDSGKMVSLLENARQRLAARGTIINRRSTTIGKKSVTLFEPAQLPARFAWAVFDKTYVYAAGNGRLENQLQRLASGPSSLSQSLSAGPAGALRQAPGSLLIVRGSQLAEAAQNLTQTGGLGLGLLVGSCIDVLHNLGDIVVSVSPEADGLRLQIREQLQ